MKRVPQEYSNNSTISDTKRAAAREFIINAKKISRTMAANYNQKKKAFESAKTSYHHTGSLDISRIYSYKTSDDIFLKTNILKEGSSHGLVCALDFSGSMRSMVSKMASQFLIMSLFCKYSDIDFIFFTFTTGHSANIGMPLNVGKSIFSDIGNNTMSEKQLIEVYYHILAFSENHFSSTKFTEKYKAFLNQVFSMDMTPLHAGIFQSFLLAKEMQMKGIQNVNILIINDGDNNQNFYSDGNSEYLSIEDPYNNRIYSVNDINTYSTEKNMLICPMNRMIRDNGIKIINMFLGNFNCTSIISSVIRRYLEKTDISSNISSNNIKYISSDIQTKGYIEIKNLCYYNSVLLTNINIFPNLTDNDNDNDKNIITSHINKTMKLSIICKLLSDKMVEDFKLFNK